LTEKRFNCHVKFSKMPNGIMVLDYTKKGKEQTVIEDISREKAHRVRDRLNELAEENEQLKQEYQKLKHRHSLLHDECIDAECDRDRYHNDVLSLEKENEQLKEQNRQLRLENGKLTHDLFWANKKIEEELG